MNDNLIVHIPQSMFSAAETAVFSGTYDPQTIDMGPDEYTIAEPMEWSAIITNVGGAFLVTGTVMGSAKTACARCLDDFTIDVNGEIEGYFIIEGQGQAPEDMDDDEFDVLSPDNDIDMAPLLLAAVLLELPLIPLCDDDCKGICQTCGKNLNEGPCECSCEDDGFAPENPFAALRNLKFD